MPCSLKILLFDWGMTERKTGQQSKRQFTTKRTEVTENNQLHARSTGGILNSVLRDKVNRVCEREGTLG